MAYAITAGNDICLCALWPSQYTGKMWEYWLKYETGSFWHCDEKSFLNMMFHNTKRQKFVTEMYHKSGTDPWGAIVAIAPFLKK